MCVVLNLCNRQSQHQHALRQLHNMTQHLCKLNARIQIISILVSEVGVLGDTLPTEVPFASYCEAAFTPQNIHTSTNHYTQKITFALKLAKISKCIFRSVASIASTTKKRNRFISASSRDSRKLCAGTQVSRSQLAAAWWFSSTERSLYKTA